MELKRRVLLYVLLAGGFAAFWFMHGRGGQVAIEQFEWSLNGDKVTYSFYVNNGTTDAVRPHVTVVAETKREGRAGTTLFPLGRAEIDLELSSMSKRQVRGTFQLDQSGDAHMVVRPQLVLPPSE